MLNDIAKIAIKNVPDSILPARVIAYRKDGSIVVAGDKFLRLALITLFGLLLGDRLTPRQIKKVLIATKKRVHAKVLEVL